MQVLRIRFTVRRTMVAVAVAAALLAAERLWQRSEFFRKKAALCGYLECQHRWYANDGFGESPEEKNENRQGNLAEALHFKILKE